MIGFQLQSHSGASAVPNHVPQQLGETPSASESALPELGTAQAVPAPVLSGVGDNALPGPADNQAEMVHTDAGSSVEPLDTSDSDSDSDDSDSEGEGPRKRKRKRQEKTQPTDGNKRVRPSVANPLYGLVEGSMRGNTCYGIYAAPSFGPTIVSSVSSTEIARQKELPLPEVARGKATRRFNREIALIIARVCGYQNSPAGVADFGGS